MPKDRYLDEFPPEVEPFQRNGKPAKGKAVKENRILWWLEGLSRAGLGETVFRIGTYLLSIALLLVVVWAMRAFYFYLQDRARLDNSPQKAALAAGLPTPTPTPLPASDMMDLSNVLAGFEKCLMTCS